MTPRSVSEDTLARVLLAAVYLWGRDHHLTVRAICAETGHSTSTVHQALGVLRERGTVGFEDGRQGTIHPTVYPVAAG